MPAPIPEPIPIPEPLPIPEPVPEPLLPPEPEPVVVAPPIYEKPKYRVVGGFNHSILPGDNLWDLAEFYWGEPTYWRFIYHDNFELTDPPDLIHAGNVLWIRGIIVEVE
jgi:hypothetical protein